MPDQEKPDKPERVKLSILDGWSWKSFVASGVAVTPCVAFLAWLRYCTDEKVFGDYGTIVLLVFFWMCYGMILRGWQMKREQETCSNEELLKLKEKQRTLEKKQYMPTKRGLLLLVGSLAAIGLACYVYMEWIF